MTGLYRLSSVDVHSRMKHENIINFDQIEEMYWICWSCIVLSRIFVCLLDHQILLLWNFSFRFLWILQKRMILRENIKHWNIKFIKKCYLKSTGLFEFRLKTDYRLKIFHAIKLHAYSAHARCILYKIICLY